MTRCEIVAGVMDEATDDNNGGRALHWVVESHFKMKSKTRIDSEKTNAASIVITHKPGPQARLSKNKQPVALGLPALPDPLANYRAPSARDS